MSKLAIRDRPYLDSHATMCQHSHMVKPFRAKYCVKSRQLIPKFSKFSLIFNQAIGAANELFVMIFLSLLTLTSLLACIELLLCKDVGLFLLPFMLYVNLYVAWHSFCELASFAILVFFSIMFRTLITE